MININLNNQTEVNNFDINKFDMVGSINREFEDLHNTYATNFNELAEVLGDDNIELLREFKSSVAELTVFNMNVEYLMK